MIGNLELACAVTIIHIYAIAELCNITVNALYAIDMDDKWIANVVYGILGIPNYKKYFALEQSWYELD